MVDSVPTRKPSLLLITSTMPGAPDDGTPAFVLDLALGLAVSFDVTVVAPRTRRGNAQWAGIRVSRFPYFFKPFEGLADDAIGPTLKRTPWRWLEVIPFLVAMTWRSAREARQDSSEIICAQWILPGGVAGVVASWACRSSLAVTVHGADAFAFNSPLLRRLKARILTRASAIFPVSESVRARILTIVPGISDETLSPPLPMGIRPLPRSETHRSKDTFLFVGRLAEKKGLEIAIRALAQVDEARLRVVGDGPLLEPLERLVEDLKLRDRVQFVGRCSRDEIIGELWKCTGLLIPSVRAIDGDEDGTPVVLAEGLASGTPVIASAIGGMPDYLTDGVTGYLVPPGDVEALAHRIRFALEDVDAFERMGEHAWSEFSDGPLDLNTTIAAYAERLAKLS